jgi:Domain of unknown function (DUF5666)
MKKLQPSLFSGPTHGPVSWLSSVFAGLLVALAVVACGGGGSVASVGSGGTGTVGVYNVGTVTGFGSVFVNGVRFDDTGASVSDEDGMRSLNDLRLGMVVRVQGSVNANGSATASSFAFDSELLGPVRSLNTASKTLVILGQTVAVDANTVFDSSLPAGFSSLQVTQTVEVHGYLNPSANTLQATFIELKNNPNRYKLSGTVTNLQSASKTFQIGQETINFNGVSVTDIPPGVANGQLIKVRLTPSAPGTGGALQAGGLRSGSSNLPSNNERVEIEGLVSAVTSTTQFSVSGVPVDARNASFTNGSAGLVVGARIEVKGSLVSGALAATQVKLKQSGANSGSSGSNSGGASGGGNSGSTGGGVPDTNEIELKGPISNVNSTAKTFALRGVVVSYAGSVAYENGNEADLLKNPTVQVKGQTAIDSSLVRAVRIKFDN